MPAIREKVTHVQVWLFERDHRIITVLGLLVMLLLILNLATIKGLWSAYFSTSGYDGRYKKAPVVEKCEPTSDGWPYCQFKRKVPACNPLTGGLGCIKGQ